MSLWTASVDRAITPAQRLGDGDIRASSVRSDLAELPGGWLGRPMDPDALNTFSGFAAAGSLALVAAVLTALRERRHQRRADLDQVSLVPWQFLSAVFSLLAVILLATAAKLYFTAAG
jgi:hypothetical protein